MRHQKKTVKLGRKAEHRNLLLANQVCSLIEHDRIKTTLAKAKAVRPMAERMVTLGKRGDLHARRLALAFLRQKDAVRKLFADVAPRTVARQGGYVRIVKLGPRLSDSAPMGGPSRFSHCGGRCSGGKEVGRRPVRRRIVAKCVSGMAGRLVVKHARGPSHTPAVGGSSLTAW